MFSYMLLFSNHHHHHHDVRLARISLTLSLHVSLSFIAFVGLRGYIPYHHIAAVWMFELVVRLLIGHMRGSTGALKQKRHTKLLFDGANFNYAYVTACEGLYELSLNWRRIQISRLMLVFVLEIQITRSFFKSFLNVGVFDKIFVCLII